MIALLLAGCPRDPDPPAPEPTAETAAPDDVLHDPLSMPAEPLWDPSEFLGAAACGECHPDHAAEWRTSMHAYAMVDPVFQALTAVRQADLDGAEDLFCQQCHSAIGTRGGEIVPGFAFEDLSPIVMEGITCTSCHHVVDVAREWNSGHVIDPASPLQGPYADATTPIHDTAKSELLGTSRFCGACHDVVESSGLPLERPYAEWAESPAAAEGVDCQGCHMPVVERPIAREAGVRRSRIHRWVGVDVPLAEGFVTADEEAAMRARTAELLAGAATLRLATPSSAAPGSTFDVAVTVRNEVAGHNLPTGSTFLRQLWLEVVVRDALGTVLYQTGTLDPDGDLRDRWSATEPYGDADLVTFHSGFVDADGAPTLFPWRAAEHPTRALQPLHERTATLFVPVPPGAQGPLEVTARLRFRALPPHLLRTLGLSEAQVAKVPIHDLATGAAEVSLAQ
jgi:hypothetical protein